MMENNGRHLSSALVFRVMSDLPSFKETKEEPSDVENPKVDRGRHKCCRGTPEYDEDSHERSRRYSDD